MCRHLKLERVGRFENFNGYKFINLYDCKKCGTSVIFVEKRKVSKIEYTYFL